MVADSRSLGDDFFTLFGLAATQALDLGELEVRFRELHNQVHPDKFAQATAAEQRASMQWATRVNEGFQTLRSPLSRARYLLNMCGQDVQVESNTAMPMDFLMTQMERREAVDAAKVSRGETARTSLEALRREMRSELGAEELRLLSLIDVAQDYPAAAGLVRQMMFQQKLLEEIDEALNDLDAVEY